MSIYATLWTLRFPKESDEHFEGEWIKVHAQAVPAHTCLDDTPSAQLRQVRRVNMQWKTGGTANLAVLGGNLPPSLARQMDSPSSGTLGGIACGLVAHRNRQVACSTPNRLNG